MKNHLLKYICLVCLLLASSFAYAQEEPSVKDLQKKIKDLENDLGREIKNSDTKQKYAEGLEAKNEDFKETQKKLEESNKGLLKRVEELEKKVTRDSSALIKLQTEKLNAENSLEESEGKQADSDKQLVSIKASLDSLQTTHTTTLKEQVNFEEEKKRLSEEATTAKSSLADKTNQLVALNNAKQQIDAEVENLRAEKLALTGIKEALEKEKSDLLSENKNLTDQIDSLNGNLGTITAERDKLTNEVATLKRDKQSIEEKAKIVVSQMKSEKEQMGNEKNVAESKVRNILTESVEQMTDAVGFDVSAINKLKKSLDENRTYLPNHTQLVQQLSAHKAWTEAIVDAKDALSSPYSGKSVNIPNSSSSAKNAIGSYYEFLLSQHCQMHSKARVSLLSASNQTHNPTLMGRTLNNGLKEIDPAYTFLRQMIVNANNNKGSAKAYLNKVPEQNCR
jgi:predicted  nucleic acid-binding Zn-ribbon protein